MVRISNFQNSKHIFSSSYHLVFYSLFFLLLSPYFVWLYGDHSMGSVLLTRVHGIASVYLYLCNCFSSTNIVVFPLAGSWSVSWWTPAVAPWEGAATMVCASSSPPGSARRPHASPVVWPKGTSWPTPLPWWRERGWSAGWWRSDQQGLSSLGRVLRTFSLLYWWMSVFWPLINQRNIFLIST